MICATCRHATPVLYESTPTGYYACQLQEVWRYRSACNIGRHQPPKA